MKGNKSIKDKVGNIILFAKNIDLTKAIFLLCL